MQRGKNWVKYFWLALVLYGMYTVGKLAFQNYQVNVHELKLREEISILQNEVQDLRNKIVYYQSDSYKEKMIRARLNLQKEGEKVVVITPEPEIEKIADRPNQVHRTNPEKWWDFFIGI